MGAIKITPADSAFSKCVRERAGWRCEKCGTQYNESSQGLHCSHHHSRGNWSIRFDPLNAEALCYGCHSHHGGTEQRRKEVMSELEQSILYEKMNDHDLGREARKTKGKGDIAKHYREELEKMKKQREDGVMGRIEFVGYF